MNPVVNTGIVVGYKIITARMMPLFVWRKGHLGKYNKISDNFSLEEFECNCSQCDVQMMAIPFIYKLQAMRDEIGMALKVNEGFRCKYYQEFLRNAKKEDGTPKYKTAKNVSQHELGNAADIEAENVQLLKGTAPKYFRAIGTASNWIHVDGRTDKIRRWNY